MDLFNPPNKEGLNGNYLELLDEIEYFPAREIIKSIAAAFVDQDGNFIEQFHTTGFDQRLWELFLFELFRSEGFEVKQQHNPPDFELIKGDDTVFVEATTSNLQEGDETSEKLIEVIKSDDKEEKERIEAFNQLKDLYIEKIGSALYSKVSKNYQDLEWVKDNPFVIAISPIHDEFALKNSDYLLIKYLYGYELKSETDTLGNLVKVDYIEKDVFEKRNKSEIPAFFSSDESKYVSAVLFSNDLSLEKFIRMGFLSGHQENIIIIRSCDIYDPESTKSKEITYFVGDEKYPEDWKQGVSIFHNPDAINPIDEDFFSGFRQVWFKGDKLDGEMPKFFPFKSETVFDTLE